MAEIDNLRDELKKLKERNEKLNNAVENANKIISEINENKEENSITHEVKPFSTNIINFSKNKKPYYINTYGNVIPNGIISTDNIVGLSAIDRKEKYCSFHIHLKTAINNFQSITVKFNVDVKDLRTLEECYNRTKEEYENLLSIL